MTEAFVRSTVSPDSHYSGLGIMDQVQTPELGEVSSIDPHSLTPEGFVSLSERGRWEVMLKLFRNGSDKDISKIKVFRPDMGMDNQLSEVDRIAFKGFKLYQDEGLKALDPDQIETWEERGIFRALDIQRDRLIGKSNTPKPNSIAGFSMGKYERYLLEEQVRREKEEAARRLSDALVSQPGQEIKVKVPELPRAA